jgi:hypothetical protein
MSGALRVVVVAVVMMMVQSWWPAVYSMTSEERKGSMAALLIKAHVCVCARACAFVDSGRWPHQCGLEERRVAYGAHCTQYATHIRMVDTCDTVAARDVALINTVVSLHTVACVCAPRNTAKSREG